MIAGVVTAAVGAVIAAANTWTTRHDNHRQLADLRAEFLREATNASDRDKAVLAQLQTEAAAINRRVDDFTNSLGKRFEAQTSMLEARLAVQAANITAAEKATAALESKLVIEVKLAQSQTEAKLMEVRTAVESKLDKTAEYLNNQLQAVQKSTDHALEQQEKITRSWIKDLATKAGFTWKPEAVES
jgi:hypothetical protein